MAERHRVVAHVLPWKAIGGTELATLRIANSAAEGGYRSIMWCRADAPLVGGLFRDHGYPVEAFDAARLEGGMLSRTRESLRIMRLLRRDRVAIVHCADVYGGDFVAIAARLAGCKVVCHVRNRYDWVSPAQRVWLAFVNRLVFVSRHTGDRFGHLARGTQTVVAQKGTVLYDGMPTQADDAAADAGAVRSTLGVPAGATLIGMVARVSIQKDHLTVVAAAIAVCRAHPEAFFVFIGDDGTEGGAEPENARRVAQAIERSPFRSRFLCTGFRPDVPVLIAALDIFLLCTHREGLPLVILEAMAQAKPVVATAVDGIPEIVQDGTTGLLHAHEDTESLARALIALLDDPSRARAMGVAGKHLIETAFSERTFAANVCALYDGLLDRGRMRALRDAPAGASDITARSKAP